MYVSLYTSFTHPNPSDRVILDSISSLTTALIKSLKLGCCRGCKFSLYFRRDVLNFLFNNCGSSVCRRPGKLFYRSDFNSVYFSDCNFVFLNPMPANGGHFDPYERGVNKTHCILKTVNAIGILRIYHMWRILLMLSNGYA